MPCVGRTWLAVSVGAAVLLLTDKVAAEATSQLQVARHNRHLMRVLSTSILTPASTLEDVLNKRASDEDTAKPKKDVLKNSL